MLVVLLASLPGLAAEGTPIAPRSVFYQRLLAGPMPKDVEEYLKVHDLMRLAGDHERAERIYAMAEQVVVRAMLGQAPEPGPAKLGDIPQVRAYSDLEFDKLRADALRRAIVPVADAKGRTPQHLTFRNHSGLAVTGFHVIVSTPSQVSDLQCRYEGRLLPRETTERVCGGYSGPRLAGGPYAITWVRVEAGGYEIKGGKGAFADTSAKTRAWLATVPPAEIAPPPEAAGTIPEGAIRRAFAQVALVLAGPGVLIGLLVGALNPRPSRLVWTIGIAAGIVAAVAALAGFIGVGSAGDIGLGGLMLILSLLYAGASALVAGLAWLVFMAGLWLGALAGALLRRLLASAG